MKLERSSPCKDENQFAADGLAELRGVVDPALLTSVKAAAEATFARADAAAPLGAAPRCVSVFALGLPFAINELVADARFERIATAHLGSAARLHHLCHVRRISPRITDRHLPFHQDETILKTPLLNVWIPLDPCGVDAPGLELVRGSWAELLPVSPLPDPVFAVEQARIDEQAVLQRFGAGELQMPEMAVGDALVFSGRTAHRTYWSEGMTNDRMSVELRFVAGHAPPPNE